jgi:hypothetical protein
VTQEADDMADAAKRTDNRPPVGESREVRPIIWGHEMTDHVVDFRPIAVPSDEDLPDPKDSSAVEPADSSEEEVQTDQTESQESPSSETPAEIAAPTVAKASTPPKVSRSGKLGS